MNVDILGSENVTSFIRLSNFIKFTIYQNNSNGNYMPLYDCNDSNSNDFAIHSFEKISEILNKNNIYKIVCYNEVETITDKNGNEKPRKASGKTGKACITFTLSNNNNFSKSVNNDTTNNNSVDLIAFRKEIVKEISQQNEQNEILNEIKNLRERFNQLDQEEEEEEEEQQPNSIAGINTDQLGQIMNLVNLFKKQPAPSLNGIDETETEIQTDFKNNINKALKILYKHNKNLDQDLLKLANLAENKTDTFNFLITSLRSM
jgi:hypothetical protein